MVTSSDESRKHVPNYSKRTRAHGHGAAEMHSGESPGVPGTQQAAGTRAGVHPSVPALIHLPGLLGTDHRWTGFVLYFDINMCNMFCSFLAHPGMKITRLMCSGRTPPNSAGGTSACERISRISAEMGILATWAVCLMSWVHWLFIFSQTALVDGFCQSRLMARHP